jgi:hypothetical protein
MPLSDTGFRERACILPFVAYDRSGGSIVNLMMLLCCAPKTSLLAGSSVGGFRDVSKMRVTPPDGTPTGHRMTLHTQG